MPNDIYADSQNKMASISLSEKIRLLIQWSPALALFTAITTAKPGRDRVTAVMALLQWVASQTDMTLDDQLVLRTSKMLLTPEGGDLVDYVHGLFTGLAEQQKYAESHRHFGS
jgi:hypothetical protein